MDEKARGYRDEILNKMDYIVRELEKSREYKLIGDYHTKENFDNHEERIKKIGKSHIATV